MAHPQESPKSPGLVVYVPGLNEDVKAIRPLLDRLLNTPELHGYAELVYRKTVTTFSRGALATRGHELAVAINGYWISVGRPRHVILMGHSIGGLLARYAYLDACGGFGGEPNQWAASVSRIVLFAAPNRGINPRRLRFDRHWMLSTALAFPAFTRSFTGTDVVVGSPFLTNLRIQWIRQFRAMANPPLVVQIRGTQDSAVFQKDSRDVETMPNSATVEIPYADHQSIIELDPANEDAPGEQYRLLASAVYGTPSPPPGPTPVAGAKPWTTDVVFLLHGIRADVFGWVQSLRRTLEPAEGLVVQYPSYGYFPAFNFAIPFGHNRQLRRFGDWYTQLLSTYPHARFHFVGHSNGTYVFGRSLEQVPAMQFDRVYLAGSVLPRSYDWAARTGQIKTLINSCGNHDLPVGILCSALRGLGRKDLGVAGFTGFDNAPPGEQFVTLRGNHSAGLAAERLPAVAQYVTTGTIPPGSPTAARPWTTDPARFLFSLLSRAMPVLAILLTLAVISGLAVAALHSTLALLISLAGLTAIATILRVW